MTSRDRVIHTLLHEPVDRAARDLCVAPSVQAAMADEVDELRHRYPNDIVQPEVRSSPDLRQCDAATAAGDRVDAWGCVWRAGASGEIPQCVEWPLADAARIDAFRPPWEMLDSLDVAAVNRFCRGTTRFVLARSDASPFQRLQLLQGREAALSDLARASRRSRSLLDALHDYFRREIEAWASTEVDGVVLSDSWGDEHGLCIPPELWRELFRPLYGDYCEILRARDKFVFFEAGGDVSELFGELVDLGVDAVHGGFLGPDIAALAAQHRDRVTFCNGLDRPRLLASGTPEEIRAAVFRVRAALDFGRGGVIARCAWDAGVPFANMVAAMEAWLAPLPISGSLTPPARAG